MSSDETEADLTPQHAPARSKVRPRLTAGEVLAGRYRIIEFIAKGGMGEVYEAEDLDLRTQIALKTIRQDIAQDERAIDRFKREILLARRVTHPSVCRIFDLGRHADVTFLTMELLRGETLSLRLSRLGSLSPAQALPLVAQLVAALSTAHRAGVVHRDFKSSNVLLVPSTEHPGELRAVVTDFGLARSSAGPVSSFASTANGLLEGTPAYIAPEQVEGAEATAAADIYALGVVMYEMVTGHTPFTGENPLAIVVRRLREPAPSPCRHVPELDPRWEAVILRCLEREPAARFATVDGVLDALRDPLAAPASGGSGSLTTRVKLPRRVPRIAAGVAVLLVVSLIALWGADRRRAPAGARPSGAAQVTSSAGLDLHPSFSPDGARLAYSSNRSGGFDIYLRGLTPQGQDVRLTSGGLDFQPAWSPDGTQLAYHAKGLGGVWLVSASGGPPRQLTRFGSRPAWSPNGQRIAFQSEALVDLAPNAVGAMPPSTLWTVAREGGEPSQVTQAGSPSGGHGAPSWSADGHRLVFTTSDRRASAVWSIAIDGGELLRLAERQTYAYDPVYGPAGDRVYYSALSESGHYGLWMLPVSPQDGRPLGEPVLLADPGLGTARHLAVSRDGSRIAYSTMTLTSNLRGVDPRATGGASPRALTSETGRNSRPVWSHDGAKLAFERWRSGSNPDIWSSDPDGSNAMPLTSDPGVDTVPNWTPDAGAIVFRSDRTGQPTIWQHAIATRHDSLLLDVRQDLDWARLSPDGREIVFNSRRGGGTTNLWRVPTAGGEPHQLTFDSQSMGFACWSPDGQLIGFEMKRGEDSHVAVIPREGGVPLQVTKDKGQSWPYSFSPDGQRIAFAGFRDGFWNIFWVARSNGEERQLTRYQQLNAYVRYPAWSPRDDQIVFEYAETTGNIWMTSPE